MKKQYVNAEIVKTRENGVTIYSIEGLENHPKAYKLAYLHLSKEIQQKMMRIVSSGEPVPVIRVQASLEIH
jgi:hypothetical protein